MFNILPAIDIKDGNCVRLFQGKYSTAEKVAESYIETAKMFESCGAKWIHMVDLDGAKNGTTPNKDIFLDVAQNTGLKVEVGGGIRDMCTIEEYLNAGIVRVILGSAALHNPELVKEAVQKFGDRIAVGIDAKNEQVAVNGWLEKSQVHYLELARQMEQIGVSTIIYTDISKDGTLERPNLEQLDRLSQSVSCRIIASGGIKDIQDIIELKGLGLYGAICGKSIYSGNLDLKEAIGLCDM